MPPLLSQLNYFQQKLDMRISYINNIRFIEDQIYGYYEKFSSGDGVFEIYSQNKDIKKKEKQLISEKHKNAKFSISLKMNIKLFRGRGK